MAFDQELAQRVRAVLAAAGQQPAEKKMFGGLSFLVSGNMCCGVLGEDLLIRVGAEAAGERSHLAATGESNAGLLRVAEIVQRKVGIGHAAYHQATVIPPREGDPLGGPVLVPEDTGGLKCLVMIDAKYAVDQGRSLGHQTADLRREVPGAISVPGSPSGNPETSRRHLP